MAWTPDTALRGEDYGRPLRYGAPTSPENTAALVRNVPPGAGAPLLKPRITPLEQEA